MIVIPKPEHFGDFGGKKVPLKLTTNLVGISQPKGG